MKGPSNNLIPKKIIKAALVGNPNTGKTSLFNALTGLRQKVGNYPGITVDKKVGKTKLSDTQSLEIIDLPGTYSINPSSLDEQIVLKTLLKYSTADQLDVVIVVADVMQLKRNLLLFTQIKDLGLPTILAINMTDQMPKRGVTIDIEMLKAELKTQVVLVSSKKNIGIDTLKKEIQNFEQLNTDPICDALHAEDDYFERLSQTFPDQPLYKTWLNITQKIALKNISEIDQNKLQPFILKESVLKQMQHKETVERYAYIRKLLNKTHTVDLDKATGLRYKLDKILTHKVFGYLIFALLSLLVFEAVFSWAAWPMEMIDQFFAFLSTYTANHLPPGSFTNLIADGIIPGLGGIIIFIPQIAILFMFMSILEETGYMSRVVFLMDKIMSKFGLSGKSVVPLISGTACAIPAVMATRNIENWKERLITILVVPFITCAARLPVYAILIALVIPEKSILGIFGLQGLTLLALYLFGFGMAIFSAFLLNKMIKIKSNNFFVIEMPDYKLPLLKNVFFTIVEKTKAFVFGAGKIILAISIILWFLANNGGKEFKQADAIVIERIENVALTSKEMEQAVSSYKLENSYIGKIGKSIEPIIQPLGYDWKIGIALLTSFAAREVFVGTLATIYSIGNVEDESTIIQRMSKETNPATGKRRFNLAVGLSLLIFYALAMQCMSTLAVVKRETKSWKWPMIQLAVMTTLAYFGSLLTYQLLS
ncbi:MAG: ferrous iron transport protein B [Chitinophagales bacterium]